MNPSRDRVMLFLYNECALSNSDVESLRYKTTKRFQKITNRLLHEKPQKSLILTENVPKTKEKHFML